MTPKISQKEEPEEKCKHDFDYGWLENNQIRFCIKCKKLEKANGYFKDYFEPKEKDFSSQAQKQIDKYLLEGCGLLPKEKYFDVSTWEKIGKDMKYFDYLGYISKQELREGLERMKISSDTISWNGETERIYPNKDYNSAIEDIIKKYN